jgi:hypothetical protein
MRPGLFFRRASFAVRPKRPYGVQLDWIPGPPVLEAERIGSRAPRCSPGALVHRTPFVPNVFMGSS